MLNERAAKMANEISRLETDLRHSVRSMLESSDFIVDAVRIMKREVEEAPADRGRTLILSAINLLSAELSIAAMRSELEQIQRGGHSPEVSSAEELAATSL